MKNNKGIILSTYIYILLVFFILILSTMLMVLNNTKIISTKLKNSTNSNVSKVDSFSIVLIGGDVTVAKGSTYVDKGYISQTTGGSILTAEVTSTVDTSTVGNYTYKYMINYSGFKKSVTRNVKVIESVYYYSYTGAAQTFVAPTNGYYLVELWGASGGNGDLTYLGGKGAYTKGQIYLTAGTDLYVYVGGAGISGCTTTLCSGGYNGGGKGGHSSGGVYQGSGGGLTDIRYGGTSINDRIMIAAGGGGGSNYPTYWYGSGGAGGALIGENATYGGGSGSSNYPGQGGMQTAGGLAPNCVAGTFGSGGTRDDSLAGGGGGYYGGGCGWGAGGGGGSSYISGYAGVNAITGKNSLTPGNNTNHYSGKYFINGQMLSGINGGNGKAKITYIDTNMPTRVGLNNVRYVKDCINGSNVNAANHWVELQAIYNGNNVALNKTVTGTVAQNASMPYSKITDGDLTSVNYGEASIAGLQCVTVDLGQSYNLDEVAVWHYWTDGRAYNENITYTSSNNSTWQTVINKYENETSQGKRVNAYTNYYYYTGAEQTFVATKTGYYNIDLVGAQGGKAGTYVSNFASNVSGKIYMQKNESLSIKIGGNGISDCTLPACLGGYNGGGKGAAEGTSGVIQASGGGATDIRYGGTSINDRIMVAGGSGGGSSYTTFWYGNGGGGGAIIGGNATYGGGSGSPNYPGQGGSQTAGGIAPNCIAGTFGNGGTRDGSPLSGGGGGYYGGGCGWGAGGGGGSSFISGYAGVNAITSASSTTPTNNTIHYSNKYFIDGKMREGVNSGNGMASIYYVQDAKPIKTNPNLNNVRYIKDCTTGSTTYTSNAYWIEIQAIKDGINVAKGKTVTGTNALNTFHSSTYSVVTNGIISDSQYEIACSTEVTTAKCVTVDLGQSYNLDEITVWHLFNSIFNNNVTSVSSDNSTWVTILSTTEPESNIGKRVSAWD